MESADPFLETDASCVSGNYFMGDSSFHRTTWVRTEDLRAAEPQPGGTPIHRRKRRGEFKQKETKLTKVRQLPSARLFFRKRSAPEPWLTARLEPAAAVHKRAQHLRQSSSNNSDLQPLRTSTLLTSVQFSLLTSVPRRYRGHRRFLVRESIAFVLYRSA